MLSSLHVTHCAGLPLTQILFPIEVFTGTHKPVKLSPGPHALTEPQHELSVLQSVLEEQLVTVSQEKLVPKIEQLVPTP